MAARLICRQNMSKLVLRAVFKCTSSSRGGKCLHMGEYFIHGRLSEIELQTPVSLAGRKYLASSTTAGFPKYLSGPKDDFPMLVKAKKGHASSMKHWALRSREIIDQAYQRYEKDGTAVAILFRGLPNRTENDLSEWVNNLRFEPFKYVGGVSPRYEVEPNVDDGAHDENVITIEPHNEMSYSKIFPKIFVISCFKKAPWGGETAIVDNRNLHAMLDPVFVRKCEEKQIRYWHCLHSEDSDNNIYQSWQNRFRTEDKEKVVEFLEKRGYKSLWEENTLFYWHNTSPTAIHVKSGEKLWFNQISSMHGSYYADMPCHDRLKLANKEYPCHSSYGDGVEFTSDEVDNHRRCLWESAVGFNWQNGDILFLDQLIVQHSRLSFEGERRVGVSLLAY